MNKQHALLIGVLSIVPALHAELAVDPIYQSHMVLQRGVKVPICGTATSSGTVTVHFGDQSIKAQVRNKKWQAVLEPMEAQAEGKPLSIRQGEESITLDDIVVGEVWLASGQSNMLWRLDETRDKSALEHEAIPAFRYYHAEPQVRATPKVYSQELSRKLETGDMFRGGWSVSSPSTCARMSAVGWYFGRKLQQQLGVPVGVIHTSLGGSEMMAWMPPNIIRKKYRDCLTSRWLDSKYMTEWIRKRARQNLGTNTNAPHPFKPGYLFQTGITPWLHFPIRGVIWYQGETDAENQDNAQNTRLLTDLILGWRAAFNAPNLPFCMVQLPRIRDNSPLRAYWPEFRMVQSNIARTLPNVSYITTIDLGTIDADVHPPRKLEVGERLANLAAAKIYGQQDIPYSGPTFAGATLRDGKVFVRFEHAEGLQLTHGNAPVGFELSEDGKTYSPAEAQLEEGGIQLSCPGGSIKHPKYLRYAWSTYLEPNLVNQAGLPTVPFAESISAAH